MTHCVFTSAGHVAYALHGKWPLCPKRLMSLHACPLLTTSTAGWIHYHIHKPEPHILLFRRQLTPESAALASQQAQACC